MFVFSCGRVCIAFNYLDAEKLSGATAAVWRKIVCLIVLSVGVLLVWCVTYKIFISFIFSVSFDGWSLVWPEPENEARDREQPRQQRDTIKKAQLFENRE